MGYDRHTKLGVILSILMLIIVAEACGYKSDEVSDGRTAGSAGDSMSLANGSDSGQHSTIITASASDAGQGLESQYLFDRTVPPQELTPEIFDKLVLDRDEIRELAASVSKGCGTTMKIEAGDFIELPYTYTEKPSPAYRYFDQMGRLVLQQNKLMTTRVKYNSSGDPIWILFSDYSENREETSIVSVNYHSNGSVEAKRIYKMTYGAEGEEEEILQCDFFVFNRRRQLEKKVYDSSCDEKAESQIELTYTQDGRPLSYEKRFAKDEGKSLESEDYRGFVFLWDYSDEPPQETITVRNFGVCDETWVRSGVDNANVNSYFYYSFGPSGELLSVELDCTDDGQIDESAEYLYDENGQVVREEKHLDTDGAADLLIRNTYNEKGLLVSQELRNLTPPQQIDVLIKQEEFMTIRSTSYKRIDFRYDSESRLVERVFDSDSLHMESTWQQIFRYDQKGRLIESTVNRDNGELIYQCTFDIRCDETVVDADSPLYSCQIINPVYLFLFPYQMVEKSTPYSMTFDDKKDFIPSTVIVDIITEPPIFLYEVSNFIW